MSKRGFQEDYQPAAGVPEPPFQTGISVSSFSTRSTAPIESVLSVEAVMKVARDFLESNPSGQKPKSINTINADHPRKANLID